MRTRESTFRKYDHLERLRHRNVTDIEHGTCWIFPKIDGTNASVYYDPVAEEIVACSRNRVLSEGKSDNHGFCAWVNAPEQGLLRVYCERNPHLVIYGEWLVKHSLGTYRDDAWRQFYVFDVYDRDEGRYLPWVEYGAALHNIAHVIDPMCQIENPGKEDLLKIMEGNTYLIKDGEGLGEGIVIKNYEWQNVFGRQPWAKMVRNAFKETMRANVRSGTSDFGIPERKAKFNVEVAIVDEFVTEHLVRKELAKVVEALAGEKGFHLTHEEIEGGRADKENGSLATTDYILANYRKRVIPWIIQQAYNCLIEEELWSALKKHRNPTIDFKTLQGLTTKKVKECLPEIF